MTAKGALLVAGATGAYALAWPCAASWAFIQAASQTMPRASFTWSPLLWWDVWPYRYVSWRVLLPVVGSAALPTLPLLLLAGAGIKRAMSRRLTPKLQADPRTANEPVRGSSDNHGHAKWMSMDDARRRFRPSPTGEPYLVIGDACRVDLSAARHLPFKPRDRRTWGPAGTHEPLVDPCTEGPTHSMFFGGSGAGKTASAITRLLHWTGSAIVVDPSNEIGPMTEASREAMGQRVVRLGYGVSGDGPEAYPACGMNVLAGINPNSARSNRRVLSAVASLCGEEPERTADSIFDDAGRNIVACLLAHIVADENLPSAHRTLFFFRELVTTPEAQMKRLLAGIAATTESSLARLLASTLMGLVAETFSGAYFNATQLTSWLFDDSACAMLSSGDLLASDVVAEPMTVFVHIELDALKFSPGVARCLLDAFAWAFIEADGEFAARTLILPDEPGKIGRLVAFELIRDTGRKYGATLHIPHLSTAEVNEVWGKNGCDLWFPSLSWRGYAAVTDMPTAKALSERFGEYAVLAVSEGDNKGTSGRTLEANSRSKGTNTSTHEISRSLIRASEIMEARQDEMFVVAQACPPLRCGVPLYFRWRDLAAKVEQNRFVRVAAE